jgi:hypothetical protein
VARRRAYDIDVESGPPPPFGDLGQRHVDALWTVVQIEESLADTFARLADTADPNGRARRLKLAHDARNGAEAARRLAERAEARLLRG